ncbi:MAG: acyl-CoA thioester hydrolase [Elusimicrobia bacterium]|nr:MAG: acyl-CoA thioester hydrolase [Elusimicrobiota bacterium]
MSSPFTVRADIQVRFRDTDAMGHVNNAVYLSYLEIARLEYWRALTKRRDWRSLDIVVARAEVDYRFPATVDMDLVVWVRTTELKRSSFVMEYRVEEKGTGRLIAEARTVQACFDYKANKVQRIPDFVRAGTLALERPGTVIDRANA